MEEEARVMIPSGVQLPRIRPATTGFWLRGATDQETGGPHRGPFSPETGGFRPKSTSPEGSTAKTDQALETFSQDRISRLNSSSSTRCARTSVRSRRSSLINREPSSRATSERSV